MGLVVSKLGLAGGPERRAHCMAGDIVGPGSPASSGSQAARANCSAGSAGVLVCGGLGSCAVVALGVPFP